METSISSIIEKTITFVKKTLEGAEAGHDWFHIQRVYHNALHINAIENAESLRVSLAALLHDIADSKFHGGDEEIGPQLAGEFMHQIQIEESVIEDVKQIIRNMSYKASLGGTTYYSHEMAVVQDADRLDAIGAIGIARAFTYGGYKNRVLYDPAIPPEQDLNKETYKNSAAPTINHFYEKLLRLKDLMHTDTGRKMAEERHEFMLQFLEQFYAEWKGKK
ncbi:HD domain-containing protein [Pedobacter antarcticus]|uniref:HD domain-containing protein n=1 Tax=Pedobacter antarcticus TaxID=34086 RepID=UPI00292E0609|nr:HD domain-containing protein [Pedobacter antarcticus]